MYWLGFNQELAVDMGLDLIDLSLIYYLETKVKKDEFKKVLINNETYYKIVYRDILEDLPILKMTVTRSIGDRLKKLERYNVLTKLVNKGEFGTYVIFKFNKGYLYLK